MPVLGPLDVTTEEIHDAALNALRLTALALAFSAYALLLDHDRLVASAGFARRSALAVALATRLVPSLERDAAGLAEAVRGRGVAARGRARLRDAALAARRRLARAGVHLAEAMEARGFGRPGRRARRGRRWTRATGLRSPLAALLVARWRRCGSSVAVERLSFSYPGAAAGAPRRVARARARARSSRCSARRARASRRCCARSRASCRTSTAAASPGASSVGGLDTRARAPGRARRHGRDGLPGSRGPGRDGRRRRTRSRSGSRTSASRRREIWPRVERGARARSDALHLAERRTVELSGGELQRVCLASALALRAAAPAARRADLAARPGRRRALPRRRRAARRRRRALGAARRPGARARDARPLRRGRPAAPRRARRRGACAWLARAPARAMRPRRR